MKKILILIIVFCSSCTATKTCPTYSKNLPVETVPEKDRFSLAERAGFVVFLIFVVYAVEESKQ